MTREVLLEKVGAWRHALGFAKAGAKSAWQLARTTKRDAKRMVQAHKVLQGPSLVRQAALDIRHAEGPNAYSPTDWARKQRARKNVNIRRGRIENVRAKATQRNAVRLGAVVLGATAGSYAYRAYKLRKKQAKERPQYRTYDVYPEHGHSTAAYQKHNRPVYYDPDEIGSGPPRTYESRDELINRIVEALTA